MKKRILFFVLFFATALPMVGQTISSPSAINTDPTFTTPFERIVKSSSFANDAVVDMTEDIVFNGTVKATGADTVLAAGFRLYGYIWRTRFANGFPKVHLIGKDSAAISVYWRKVALGNSQVLSVGPWIACGSAVTFNAPVANRDTLFQVAGAASDSTAYLSGQTNAIQFSYVIVDGSNPIGTGNLPEDTKNGWFHTWVGRAVLTWTRYLADLL